MDNATLDALDIGAQVVCKNPECKGIAEPEQDGDHGYWACTTCGFEFGYHKIETTQLAVDAAGSCAIGVPESIRRAFSGPKDEPERPQPVALGLTIPVRSSL